MNKQKYDRLMRELEREEETLERLDSLLKFLLGLTFAFMGAIWFTLVRWGSP